MILVSFGSPSAISYAVVDIVSQLLAGCVDAHKVLQVVDLADFEARRRQASEEGNGAVLVASDCPRADLVRLFAEAGQPVLVCCDRLEHVVRYNMRSRGMDCVPALRFATQVLSALDALTDLPHVMRVTHRRDGDPLRATVASIAAFLGLDRTDGQFEAAMQAIVAMEGVAASPDEGPTTFREHVARRFPHAREGADPALTERERVLVHDLGRCYAPLVEGQRLDLVAWPVGLLLDWDRPGRFLDGAVDLLGPARFVVCGPYLHLPAGRWRMTVDFETRDCLSDNRIEADVFDGRILAAVAVALPVRGRYAVALDVTVVDPMRPVELRIRLVTGAIEGSLAVLRLGFARSGDSATASVRTREAA